MSLVPDFSQIDQLREWFCPRRFDMQQTLLFRRKFSVKMVTLLPKNNVNETLMEISTSMVIVATIIIIVIAIFICQDDGRKIA